MRDLGTSIVVVGDTQRTTWGEWFFLNREQNEAARRALIERIAAEENPAFVVHLGDMVSNGDRAEWEYFEHLMSPLTVRRIPVAPVLGNHDYWGDGAVEARFRYPWLSPDTFYAHEYRGLGLIWLNTNLRGDAAQNQARWFDDQLRTFEGNGAIRGILVFAHHPALTNGKDRSGDPYVLSALLPRFESYTKSLVFLSGHVHGYERFVVNGKTYVVSGGGGGPRVEYLVGGDVRTPPAYKTKSGAPRAFNYVVIDLEDSKLTFAVKCIDTPGGGPRPIRPDCRNGLLERFTVALPEPAPDERGRAVRPARDYQ